MKGSPMPYDYDHLAHQLANVEHLDNVTVRLGDGAVVYEYRWLPASRSIDLSPVTAAATAASSVEIEGPSIRRPRPTRRPPGRRAVDRRPAAAKTCDLPHFPCCESARSPRGRDNTMRPLVSSVTGYRVPFARYFAATGTPTAKPTETPQTTPNANPTTISMISSDGVRDHGRRATRRPTGWKWGPLPQAFLPPHLPTGDDGTPAPAPCVRGSLGGGSRGAEDDARSRR
jgi:hypothetical protein